ncbi:hypothetical protein AKJ09_05836 [Labilithrix luteola]|uniref:Alpha-galactosidase NEW3 domain-containing protein n=1 Tax=Labilithrix luteola TaxID=1391654 RepID=A0A0K1Q099_9BACT|nr:hypothetical protein [Labilithrix luteola]AKU99172.1 hypothetical protein AKJ09_05836 [Labilithrix luteola]
MARRITRSIRGLFAAGTLALAFSIAACVGSDATLVDKEHDASVVGADGAIAHDPDTASGDGGSKPTPNADADSIPDSGEDAEAAPAPDFTIAMNPPSITTTLGTVSHYTITLTSAGFSGPVSLVASGLPTGWTATFTPDIPTLDANKTVTVDVKVDVPIPVSGFNATLQVTAKAASLEHSASSLLNVASKYVLTIANGAGGGNHGFPTNLRIKVGTTLVVRNEDTTAHQMHYSAPFAHQSAPMGQGEEYAQTATATATSVETYCHSHGPAGSSINLAIDP